jgi:peptide/nickel transport system permease protein
VPGDPARSYLGVSATPEQYEAMRNALHLNEPILTQYWIYLTDVFHGNLGTSIFTGDPVALTLSQRLPVSLSIILGGTIVSAVIGIALGVFSATRGRALRSTIDVVSLAGFALPNFWVGLVLAAIFAVSLGLLPATGYVPFSQSPSEWALGLILPVAALSLAGIASIAKVARDRVKTAMGMDYIRTLRASGVPERSLVWKHALRNSGLTISTMIGLVFIGSLSGTIMVETVFVLPGLGSTAVDATNKHDIPLIQGVALAFTVLVIVINLIVDVGYGIIDRRVRVS